MSSLTAVTSYGNFSRAQVDSDLNGRFELPIYSTGFESFQNFISNFKGNAIFSAGFERLIDFQDCALIEFKFSQNQNYILVLYNTKMRVLTYDGSGVFGWVLDSGSPLEITTPYSLAESKEIAFRKAYSQNFDSMIFTHEDHEPYELTRLTAATFTFRVYARKDDPFPNTWAATQTITAVTAATEAQIIVATHTRVVGDRVRIQSIVGMTELNDWTAAVIEVVDGNNFKIDVDTSGFTAYSSAGTIENVTAGDYPATCLYYKGRLYYGGTKAQITTTFGSESGSAVNPYKVHTLPATVLATSALQFTIAELTSRIEWLFGGQNSLIVGANTQIVAVHGGSVGTPITAETIDTTLTSADGANNVEPLSKDGFIFYVGNDGRNLLFFAYDLLSETFEAEDANVIAYDITTGGVTKIRYVKNRDNLIFGLRSDGALLTCNFNKKENIIGWHERATEGTFQDIAQISDNDGIQQIFALTLRSGSYYIERQAPYVEFSKRKDFYTDKDSLVADNNAWYRTVVEELKNTLYLDNSETFSDFHTTTITYDSGAGTITDPGAPFVAGDVDKQIVYKTLTGYESGRFLITAYNSTTSVDVDVLQTPTATTSSTWYLSFDDLSGLSRFNGETVGVVADGGFLAAFEVSAGAISLGEQVTHVSVGHQYTGYIESFTLGNQIQTENTQITMKTIKRMGARCLNTMGGKLGADRYTVQPIQKIRQGNLNYLTPPPITITEFVDMIDDPDKEKRFVIVQDEPGPMLVTNLLVDANYVIAR
ncbi:MAG: ubiquitin-activating E1 FCCH domain-containing protein [Methylococcaceae bacterium]